MDNFIVSARKYRPATFSSVVGQKSLTDTLKKSIDGGHLAHAYLFCGPRGVGKTTCARIFAKAINCLNPRPDHEACNECESCRAFNEQRSFNIHELDAASNNSVDDIRQLIEQVRIPPQIGRYSVYIIDEVHQLSTAAFNAFLKTLEEPPAYAIFILATTEKHKVIPTILSRCQIYDFSRITVKDTVDHLAYVAHSEGVTAEPEALQVIAQKADGGMRDALSIFDQMVSYCGNNITYRQVIENLNVLDTEYFFRLVDCFLKGDTAQSLLLFDEIINKGFDQQNFIGGLAQHLRDVLVSRDPQTTRLLDTTAAVAEHYARQAQVCPPRFIFEALKLANECDLSYRTARNRRLLIELTLLRLCQLTAQPVQAAQPAQPLPSVQQVQAQPAPQPAPQAPAQPAAAPQPAQQAQAQPAAAPQPAPQTTAQPAAPAQPNPARPEPPRAPQARHISIAESLYAEKEETAPAAVTATYGNKPFTEDQVVAAWRGFASTTGIDERMKSILLTHTPRLTDAATFQVDLDNNMQIQDINRIRERLLAFIRQRLDNGQVDYRLEVSENSENRAFTAKKRYELLVEQNPELANMSRQLGLQID